MAPHPLEELLVGGLGGVVLAAPKVTPSGASSTSTAPRKGDAYYREDYDPSLANRELPLVRQWPTVRDYCDALSALVKAMPKHANRDSQAYQQVGKW
jgi:hypothetical protein